MFYSYQMNTFYVKTLSGQIVNFDISIKSNITKGAALYVKLALKTRNPNDIWIPIYLNNKLIDFNKKLSDYNIKNDYILSQRIYMSSSPNLFEKIRINKIKYIIDRT